MSVPRRGNASLQPRVSGHVSEHVPGHLESPPQGSTPEEIGGVTVRPSRGEQTSELGFGADAFSTNATQGAHGPSASPPGRFPETSGISPLAPTKTSASAKVRVTTPAVVLRPLDIIDRVQDGNLTVSIPMTEGHVFGSGFTKVTVRKDTWASVALVIENGKVDFSRTQVSFERSDGTETDLDGPLLWNAERIYIEDGRIMADVPCFPDPDITHQILDGCDRVPDDPQEFLRVLGRGQLPNHELIGKASFGNLESTVAPAAADAPSSPSEGAASPSEPSVGGGLGDVLNLAALRASFDGTFKPGAISLGEGAHMVLGQGSKVSLRGTLADMHADIDASIHRMDLAADGTFINAGRGRLGLRMRLVEQGHSEITVQSLATETLRVETPASHGVHVVQVGNPAQRGREHFSVEAKNGEEPLIRTRLTGDGERELFINLPRVRLRDVTGQFQVDGTDGRPAVVRLRDPSSRAMNVEAALRYDSIRQSFVFDSDITNLKAEVSNLALVHTEHLQMDLGRMRVSGSGRFAVHHDREGSQLTMEAKDEEWRIEAQVADAKIGSRAEGSRISADLSHETQGQLSFKHLSIGTRGDPRFAGSARFRVRLDDLEVRMGRDAFRLQPGTWGDLIVNEMAWREGAAAPEVNAKLILDITGNAIITPERIEGLRGAEVKFVDGRTHLELDAILKADGTVETTVDMQLRDLEVRTTHGSVEALRIGQVNLPAEPLEAELPPVQLRRVDLPIPPSSPLVVSKAPVELPDLPPMRIRPGTILEVINDTSLKVRIPTDAFRARLFESSTLAEIGFWRIRDTTGRQAAVDVSRAKGSLLLDLVMKSGQVVPEVSRLVFDNPLKVDLWGKVHLPGPGTAAITERAEVHAVVIKRDEETGRGYLWPVVSFDGWALEGADLVGLGDYIRRATGNLLAEAIFGAETFSLDGDDITAALSKKLPALNDELVFTGPSGAPLPGLTQKVAPSSASSPLETILSAIRFRESEIRLENTTFEATSIPLGDGQIIELGKPNDLRVSGTLDDFEIKGTATLGRVNLGLDKKGGQLALTNGRAAVTVRVQRGAPDEPPRIEVIIDDLNTTQATLSARVGGLDASLSDADIRGGRITIRAGGGSASELGLELPQVTAHLVAQGGAQSDGVSVGAEHLDARIRGSFFLDNGRAFGELDHVDLSATGLGVSAAENGAQVGSMRVRGAASLNTDSQGNLTLASRSGVAKLTVCTDFTSVAGSRLEITDGSAELISIGANLGEVRLHGLAAENVKGLVDISAADNPEQIILQVHGGRIILPESSRNTPASKLPGLVIKGDGFYTLGALEISEFDGSLRNVGEVHTGSGVIDLEQIDMTGRGTLEISPTGEYAIHGKRQEKRSTLRAVGVARRSTFQVVSPRMNAIVLPGAYMATEVDKIRLAPGMNGVDLALLNGHIEAKLESGTVTVGTQGSALETLTIKRDARLSADIARLHLRNGAYAPTGTTVEIDSVIRLEGAISDQRSFSEVLSPETEPVDFEHATIDGRFRMILGMHYDDEQFAAKSHVLLDADARARARTRIDPERIRAAFRRGRGEPQPPMISESESN